jgi:tRNA/tmRNA/rRNA uracil-C5-methylase (TrmA/RlmC/RlmD family)
MLTAAIADRVGPTGRVLGLESSRVAVADAALNLAAQPWAEVRAAKVTAAELAAIALDADLVILDPPRSGAGPAVLTEALMRRPRAVCYVACDPAALARDLRTAFDLGWRLTSLRAFDAFPMTHHVECVALLEPGEEIEATVRVAGEARTT